MKQTLLSSVAIAALAIGGPALAQDTASAGIGDVEVTSQDMLATEVIGMSVHATGDDLPETGATVGAAEDGWNEIGDVDDIVLGPDGSIEAVVVGVGGFLGIGEKSVAIAMDDVRPLADPAGVTVLAVSTTQEDLESAPAFEMPEAERQAAAGESAESGEETMADSQSADSEQMADDTQQADSSEAQPEVMEESREATQEAQAEATDGDSVPGGTDADAEMAESDQPAETEGEGRNLTAEAQSGDMAEEGQTEMAEGDQSGDMAEEGQTDQSEIAAAGEMEAPEGYSMMDEAELTAESMTGMRVYGPQDQSVGEIDSLLVTNDGEITDAIINVGGFLGLGEKPVSVSMDDLAVMTNGSEYRVEIGATEDELRDMPRYEG